MIEIHKEDKENEAGILHYLKACFPSLAARDALNASTQIHYPCVLSSIAERCEGSFLHAYYTQQEMRKREAFDTMTIQEMSFLQIKALDSVYHAYFHRLEIELKAVMKRKPDLYKLLDVLVAAKESLSLAFIARALDLALDGRETKRIIKQVNEAVSCLFYVPMT